MDQQLLYLAVVFLALEFTGVNAIRCQVCTYAELGSDNESVDSLMSLANSGSSSCWGTDITLMEECDSIYTACSTLRADFTGTFSTRLGSGNAWLKSVAKACAGNVGSDTCAAKDSSSYLSSWKELIDKFGVSVSGEVTNCICHKNGCNHGNVVGATSIPVYLAFTMAALVHLIYN